MDVLSRLFLLNFYMTVIQRCSKMYCEFVDIDLTTYKYYISSLQPPVDHKLNQIRHDLSEI